MLSAPAVERRVLPGGAEAQARAASSAGYDNVDLEAARRAKVPLSNNGGANAISVSEHAIMLMLTVARKVIWQHGSVSGGRWRGNGPAPRMYELHDKTLGIIGFGTIGKKVARLAKPFGMHVQYFDIARLSEGEADAHGVKFRLLRELLRTSDIVSLHVPLNDSTRHLIGKEELELMKPHAILVNTSRGPVIDEVALHAHLRQARSSAPASMCSTRAAAFEQSAIPPRQRGADRAFRRPTWDNHVARFRNAFDNVQRRAWRACVVGGAELAG